MEMYEVMKKERPRIVAELKKNLELGV